MTSRDSQDYIRLEGLRLRCRIGVTPRERRRRQTIVADIALRCNLRPASRSDRLEDTVDYAALACSIARMAEAGEFRLLETLAEQIAAICLADAKVAGVLVRVNKRNISPILGGAAVAIRREK